MKVNGYVRIILSLNVCDLETDAVDVSEYGNVKITDPDEFFNDWIDAWNGGIGELMGVQDESAELEVEEDEDEDDD